MNRASWRWITCAAIAAGAFVCVKTSVAQDAPPAAPAAPAPAAGSSDRIKPGLTTPFKEYRLCFPTIGVIREVKIKEGDVIKQGDVLMVQDDREEKAELKLLELDVNELAIEAAKAKERVAAIEFKAKEELKKQGGGNDLEVEQARAEWDVAKIQIEAAKQEHKQKDARREKQHEHVQRMSLVAPVSGVVKELINDVGSNVDPTKQVVTIVENNPIRVRVHVPALASLQLKLDEKMRVSYDKKNWKDGTVKYMAPQADAGSGTRLIIIEVPNTENDPSGLRTWVELPEKLLATADGK
jgi:RND family efflux transporter MFP subunit